MEITKEVVEEFINSNADYQEELKGKYTVEKEVIKEIDKPYSIEGVKEFLGTKEAQSLHDTFYETARRKVYGKLHGKEEITEDDLNAEFTLKSNLTSLETELKETVIKSAIGEENFLKAKDFIDFSKVKKTDKGWEGIDNLKTLFPQQQIVKPVITPNASTPPAGKTAEQIKKEESDNFLKHIGLKQ